jgi:GTPase
MFERPAAGENALLVQLDFGDGDFAERFEEFQLLATSAGACPVETITGKR